MYVKLTSRSANITFKDNKIDRSLLIIVLSARGNIRRRERARNTWIKILSKETPIMFFVGQAEAESKDGKIALEKKRFGDIIELDLYDHYNQSSKKMLGMLKYVSKHYSAFDAILKLDDDSLPNIVEIKHRLSRLPMCKYWWWGDFRFQEPEQDKRSPWYIKPQSTLKWIVRGHWPLFSSGWAHIMSMSAIQNIASKSVELTHEIWMEDVAIAAWFDEALKNVHPNDICRFHDLSWLGQPSSQCTHKYLAMKEMVEFERTNKETKHSLLSKRPYLFSHIWSSLKMCSNFCGCNKNLASDHISILNGISTMIDPNEMAEIFSRRLARIKIQEVDIGEIVLRQDLRPISFALITNCERWESIERILSRIDIRSPFHIFGKCTNMAFDMCFRFRRQHVNVWCHEGNVNTDNVLRHFSKRNKAIFELMFGFYPYVVFIKDNFVASNRVVEYLELSRKLMETDETILCVSVPSDNGINHTASFHIWRHATANDGGWMSSASVYRRFIQHNIIPSASIGNAFMSTVVNANNINKPVRYSKCRFACVALMASQDQNHRHLRKVAQIQGSENVHC